MPRDRWPRIFRADAEGDRVERALDEELEFHLAMREQRLRRAGHDPVSARRAALEKFGDLRAVRAECLLIDHETERTVRRMQTLTNIRQDTFFAARTLWQRKGFTAVMLAVLALGIGANTATFSVVDALMLSKLPVEHPDALVTVGDPTRTGWVSQGTPRTNIASYPEFVDLRERNHVFSDMYATGRAGRLDVIVNRSLSGASDSTGGGPGAGAEAEHPRGRYVSGSFFSVLGVGPRIGRLFGAEEDRAIGASSVVVISHGWWQRRFASDPAVVGKTLSVNGVPMTIIGVGPRDFTGDLVGQSIDVWLPLTMQSTVTPHDAWLDDRSISWLLIMGRLKSGVTLGQARAELQPMIGQALLEHLSATERVRVERALREEPPLVGPGSRGFSYLRSVFGAPLLTITVAVGLVLLIVCANVANLMLARAAARGREISVRMALGAGRGRLVQQLLTESVLLALTGAALGLLVALAGRGALLRLAGGATSALPLAAHLSARVLAFTAAIAVVTAILFGLMPALRATRVQLAGALRGAGRGTTGAAGSGGRTFTLGKLLVVAQVALSILVLVGSGMLVRSTQRLLDVDVGMARDELLVASVDLSRAGYAGARQVAFMRELVLRLGRVPGVRDVSMSENGLFSGTESGTWIQAEGFTATADGDSLAAYDDVLPGYFRTIGAHVLQGRDFEERDNESGARVAIVNRTMAEFYFPNGDAIGRHIRADSTSYEIVGIVGDVIDHDVRGARDRRLYIPMFQLSELPPQVKIEVRVTGNPARLVTPLREALRDADASLAILSLDPLTDLVRDSVRQDRMLAQVVSAFAILALILAALGLYGVMAYATSRRIGEFGLRAALGAEPGTIARMVLRESVTVVVVGVALGVPLALLAMRSLKSQLFGIGVVDLPSLAISIAVLGGSAILAGYLPARRASRVAPLVALRGD